MLKFESALSLLLLVSVFKMLFTDLLGLPKFTNKILFEGKNLFSHDIRDVNIFSSGLGNGVYRLSILPRFLSHTVLSKSKASHNP